jgi:hypothetical protein
MTKADLSGIYRDYITCLNKQDWPNLGQFVHEEVHYNGEHPADSRSQQTITLARDQVIGAENSNWQEPFRLIRLKLTGPIIGTRS